MSVVNHTMKFAIFFANQINHDRRQLISALVQKDYFTSYKLCDRIYHSLLSLFITLSLHFQKIDGSVSSVYGFSESEYKSILLKLEQLLDTSVRTLGNVFTLFYINQIRGGESKRVLNKEEMLILDRGKNATAISSGGNVTGSGGILPGLIEERVMSSENAKIFVNKIFEQDSALVTLFGNEKIWTALKNDSLGKLAQRFDKRSVGLRCLVQCSGEPDISNLIVNTFITSFNANVEIKLYKIDYGTLFSSFRGESEKNVESIFNWFQEKVNTDTKAIHVIWIDSVELLMGQRDLNTAQHFKNIKNLVLQYMDDIQRNVDRTKPYGMFFTTAVNSIDEIDEAFRRRLNLIIAMDTVKNATWFKRIAFDLELKNRKLNVSTEIYNNLLTYNYSDAVNKLIQYSLERENSLINGFNYIDTSKVRLYNNDGKYYNISGEEVTLKSNTLYANKAGSHLIYTFDKRNDFKQNNLNDSQSANVIYVIL